ncbi:thioredoxin family protein [Ottowia thiooxydans]|uniref:thioredoxin family protein n=1 Tax=Ottowia thiooxydans TaxID=219182 RepID=UPI000411C4AE|nr:thioredoxin domain-containing protein [Ottowia thiooxydans]
MTDIGVLVARSTTPVLVDCFTPGCGPCAALAPILDTLADELKEQLAVEKIDVGANPEVAKLYGVRGVPTLLLFKDGKHVASRTGAASRTQLITWLSAHGAV